MANLPQPKSYNQILSEMLSAYMARIGVNDLQTGSVVTSFYEAVAQVVYRSSGDIFQVIRDFSVDRASGESLKRIGEEERVFPIPAKVSTGTVTIVDSSFNKIATKVYSGDFAPNVGSTSIKVSDASLFTPTGQIYIGRGTPNVEGPISYTSITPIGSYYQINLSTPTTKYHNITESVILAQGGVRNIPVGISVKTIGTGGSDDITFTTTTSSILLDGESEITGVPVAALVPGSASNIPRNSIKEFAIEPFTGATVFNDSPFTTGKDEESDDEYRARIKRARISKGLGTSTSIKNSTLGASAQDENASVTSNEILSTTDQTILFVDNGSLYEEKSQGVGLEAIVDSALGGEQYFQLSTGGSQTSIAKAFIESTLDGPYQIYANDRLSILIGGVESEHIFASTDFRAEGAVTAYELTASINANSSLLFSARTSNNGKKLVLFAKTETFEYIQVTTPSVGVDASVNLFLPRNKVETIKLYKNNLPLQKDGVKAFIESEEQNSWSNSLATGETLILKVDNTQFITYTLTDADFLSEGTHTTLAKTNVLESWVNVFNNKLIGVTASVSGTKIVLTSNLGISSRAKIEIDSASTLVTNGMFSSSNLVSSGVESDFTLSRNTAQLKLKTALLAGDKLTAGSDFTNASIQTSEILGGIVTLTSDALLWFITDNEDAEIINSGAISDTLIDVAKPSANIVRYTSNQASAFANIAVGDYVIVWCEELNANNRIEGRVNAKTSNTFDIKITASEYALAQVESGILIKGGFVFIRTKVTPQKIAIVSGTYNVNDIATHINNNAVGLLAKVDNDEIIIVYSETSDTSGCVFLPTYNTSAKSLNFTLADKGVAGESSFGFIEESKEDSFFPLFQHDTIAADNSANTPYAYLTTFDATTTPTLDPNALLKFLHPYSSIQDAQGSGESVQVKSYSTNTIDFASDSEPVVRRVRQGDRFYYASPYNFGHEDSIVITLDADTVNKTFQIPLYRKATVNATAAISPNNFRAYDVQSGATASFDTYFPSFNFANFKVLMKARNAITPKLNTVNQDSLLFRSAVWGEAGEKYKVGIFYPTVANASIQHTVTVADDVKFNIYLQSGAPVSNTIDASTEWNITVVPNTPVVGMEEVTYVWSGVGTIPNLSALAIGDYVTINSNGEFSERNQGTFKVQSSTNTAFVIHRYSGEALAESAIATLSNVTMFFYEDSATTAAQINTYVNANMSNWLESSLLNDNGTTGSGVIDTSTYDDIASTHIQLKDGLNWILSSNVAAVAPTAQFVFKKSLELPSISTATANAYTFNGGEEIRLIPTTAKQLKKFLSVLAVSGVSTFSSILNSARQTKVQIISSVLGSDGAVQVFGGTGNNPESPITSSASKYQDKTILSVNKSLASGIESGYVKLIAQNLQRKDSGISSATNVTITPNSPIVGQSKITLANKEPEDLYFGIPRFEVKPVGRTFHVEKHGKFTCFSWNGSGTSPFLTSSVDFNNATSNMTVFKNTTTGFTEYTAVSLRDFSECSKGDVVTISGFVNEENNGTFNVVGTTNNGLTVILDNSSGVTESSISIASGNISITSDINEGDTVIIGAPFATLNRGTFSVIKRFNQSFYIENENSVDEIVTASGTSISIGGDVSTQYNITKPSARTRLTYNGTGLAPSFANIKVGDYVTIGAAFNASNQGEFMVVGFGSTYVEFYNVNTVVESNVVGNASLSFYSSPLKFYHYDAAQVGDTFTISGDSLGTGNIGSYEILDILDENNIIVSGTLVAAGSVNLGSDFQEVYVTESSVFSTYKKIDTIAVDPSNSDNLTIVLSSARYFQKLNDTADILVSATSKMSLPQSLIKGVDSYRFNTGLISEVNRIVYGDPRDSVTYPGVSAAGAEIFIQAPLFRRVQISINVRVNTGIPFTRVTEQVRNNIFSLINSSPIGQSIAISDIIATVNSIPGVSAVSISSPQYSPTSDVIIVNQSEKALILDIIEDIIVSKVG
jgi:uncharacterized phage protein gp47/JayE